MSIALKARANKVVTGAQGLVGEIGIAQTPLSPQGKVFVHGEIWNATSSTNVAAGESVVVRNLDGLRLRVDPQSAGSNRNPGCNDYLTRRNDRSCSTCAVVRRFWL